jgi:hypothetical protein
MDNIVLKITAKAYGVDVKHLIANARQKGITPEAQRMATLFLSSPHRKVPEIAKAINRDRTIVYSRLSKIHFEIKTYKDVQQKFNTIQMSLISYLETTKTDLENWLKNNPCQDQEVRDQKLERLADINETHQYITNL